MKKFIAILLMLTLFLALPACSEGGNAGEDAELYLITGGLISPYAVYQMAGEIQQNPAKNRGKSIIVEGDLVASDISPTGYSLKVSDDTGCCYAEFEITVPEKYRSFVDTFVYAAGTYKSRVDGDVTHYYIDAEEIGDWFEKFGTGN